MLNDKSSHVRTYEYESYSYESYSLYELVQACTSLYKACTSLYVRSCNYYCTDSTIDFDFYYTTLSVLSIIDLTLGEDGSILSVLQ